MTLHIYKDKISYLINLASMLNYSGNNSANFSSPHSD